MSGNLRGKTAMEIVAESTQAGNSQLTRAKPEVNSRQRKRLITPSPQAGTPRDEVWLDLDREAVVEITSEEKEYPVEAALAAGGAGVPPTLAQLAYTVAVDLSR
jgi:hypothetical protein